MQEIIKYTAGRSEGTSRWPSRIRKLTAALGGLLFLAVLDNPNRAFSQSLPYSITLAWDQSPSPEVTGYRVYYGAVSGNYSNSIVVGNLTTNTVAGLTSGVTYFFAVTAYNANDVESTFSNEMSFVPGLPGLPGVGIQIASTGQAVLTVRGLTGQTYDIEATEDFVDWTVIGTVTLGGGGSLDFTDTNAASFPQRFYRTQQTP